MLGLEENPVETVVLGEFDRALEPRSRLVEAVECLEAETSEAEDLRFHIGRPLLPSEAVALPRQSLEGVPVTA